jgi:hypothetical protein
MKDFQRDFFAMYHRLKSGVPFAFTRFSDGELRIMENKELILGEDFNKIGRRRRRSRYTPEDRKHFNPAKHQHVREKLMLAYQYKAKNYFVGLSCRCCVGDAGFNKMVDWYGGDDDQLTWANLWVNANYKLFREYMIPAFSENKVAYIVNEAADLSGLPFEVVKDFRIGDNCIVNDFNKHEEVDRWITDRSIKRHLFLFSASSLSNIMIYELYRWHPQNTYIDIGTTLNIELGLPGTRGYLTGKNQKVCIW